MIWPDDFINKIVCGDAYKLLPLFPDKSVDLVLTDPPYGIGESNEKNLTRERLSKPKDYGHYEWDQAKVRPELLRDILRIGKNQIIWGGNYYASILGDTSCFIVWDKDNTGDFADCELAWTSFKSAVRKYRYRWNGMLQENMKHKEFRSHPTQKPLALMVWCLERYSKPGDLILDPFLGSGTTAVAAKLSGRRFIGVEVDPRYCAVAEDRLRQEVLPLTTDGYQPPLIAIKREEHQV